MRTFGKGHHFTVFCLLEIQQATLTCGLAAFLLVVQFSISNNAEEQSVSYKDLFCLSKALLFIEDSGSQW